MVKRDDGLTNHPDATDMRSPAGSASGASAFGELHRRPKPRSAPPLQSNWPTTRGCTAVDIASDSIRVAAFAPPCTRRIDPSEVLRNWAFQVPRTCLSFVVDPFTGELHIWTRQCAGALPPLPVG